jgi:hypothetical protein
MNLRYLLAGIAAIFVFVFSYAWLFEPIEFTSEAWPSGPRLKCLENKCAVHFNEYNGYPNAFRPLNPTKTFNFKPYTENPTAPWIEDQIKWPQFIRDESKTFPNRFPNQWVLLGTSSLTGGSKIEVYVRSTDSSNEYEIKFEVENQKTESYVMERANIHGVPFPKSEPYIYKQSRFDKVLGQIIS